MYPVGFPLSIVDVPGGTEEGNHYELEHHNERTMSKKQSDEPYVTDISKEVLHGTLTFPFSNQIEISFVSAVVICFLPTRKFHVIVMVAYT